MASTIHSGDTLRWITSAQSSSKKEPPTETLSLHFIEASPFRLASSRKRQKEKEGSKMT
jgi:hypothetical protein